MALANSLAQEIIQSILEHISLECDSSHSAHRARALAPCTLVSKPFSAEARRIVFSTTHINPLKSSAGGCYNEESQYLLCDLRNRIQCLNQLLAHDSALVPQSDLMLLIRTLHIHISLDIVSDSSLDKTSLEVLLTHMISEAHNLATVHIAGPIGTGLRLPWTKIASGISQAFVTLCQLGTIQHLQFSNIGELPRTLFADYPIRRSVSFAGATRAEWNIPPASSPLYLRRLELDGTVDDFWAHWCKLGEPTLIVEIMRVFIDDQQQAAAFAQLLRKVSRSLVELDMSFFDLTLLTDESTNHYLRPGFLPLLYSLTLQFRQPYDIRTPTAQRILSSFALLIKTSSPQIDEITLIIDVELGKFQLDQFLPDFQVPGDGLRSSMFSQLALRKLTIKLSIQLFRISQHQTDKTSEIRGLESSLRARLVSLVDLPLSLDPVCVDGRRTSSIEVVVCVRD